MKVWEAPTLFSPFQHKTEAVSEQGASNVLDKRSLEKTVFLPKYYFNYQLKIGMACSKHRRGVHIGFS
jgi:hypothetical protein